MRMVWSCWVIVRFLSMFFGVTCNTAPKRNSRSFSVTLRRLGTGRGRKIEKGRGKAWDKNLRRGKRDDSRVTFSLKGKGSPARDEDHQGQCVLGNS